MARHKRKQKQSRRKGKGPATGHKPVNDLGRESDKNDPSTWGPVERPRKVGKAPIDAMYEQGGLTHDQKRAADIIHAVFMYVTAGLWARGVDLNRVGPQGCSSSDPVWFIEAHTVYLNWLSGLPERGKAVSLALIVDATPVAEVMAIEGVGRQKVKKLLLESLNAYLEAEARCAEAA